MKLFGGRLPVISVPELIDQASHTKGPIHLEVCSCRELGKLVVRVVEKDQEKGHQHSRLLVSKEIDDYFVAGRNVSGIRRKLERYLMPIRNRLNISQCENGVLRLFQGGAVTEIGNSVMGR